jgi:hypothetical protein
MEIPGKIIIVAIENKWKYRGLYRIFSGSVKGDDILFANLELHGKERYYHIDYVMNDFRQLQALELSERDIEKISVIDDVSAKSKKHLKIALLIRSEYADLADRYIEAMKNSDFKCARFTVLEDAEAWLGIREQYLSV